MIIIKRFLVVLSLFSCQSKMDVGIPADLLTSGHEPLEIRGSLSGEGLYSNQAQSIKLNTLGAHFSSIFTLSDYKVQIAIGKDANADNSIDTEEAENVMTWMDFTNFSQETFEYTLTHGEDNFSFNLEADTDYFISLRSVEIQTSELGSPLTSSAIRRRFIPSDITGLQAWFSALDRTTLFQDDTCSTLAESDSDSIGCWQDKTSNENHALQTSAGLRPTRNDSRQGLLFDGSTTWLDLQSDTGFPSGGSARSIFVAFDATDLSGSWTMLFAYGTNSNTQGISIGRRTVNCVYTGIGSDLQVDNCLATNQWTQYSTTFDGTNSIFRKNGTLIDSDTMAWNTTLNVAYIGRQVNGSEYWAGNIGEILVYDSVLSDDDREKVDGYLACLYNQQDLLASDHPYRESCP